MDDLAIIAIDARGHVIAWNDGAERIFGHRRDAALGKSVALIVPPDLRGQHLAGVARTMGKPGDDTVSSGFEITGVHASGAKVTGTARLARIKDPAEVTVGAVFTFRKAK